jgi:hypothetical protein
MWAAPSMAICAATVTSTWCRRSALRLYAEALHLRSGDGRGLVHSASCSPMRQGWARTIDPPIFRRLSGAGDPGPGAAAIPQRAGGAGAGGAWGRTNWSAVSTTPG